MIHCCWMPPACAGHFDRQTDDLWLCTPYVRQICKIPVIIPLHSIAYDGLPNAGVSARVIKVCLCMQQIHRALLMAATPHVSQTSDTAILSRLIRPEAANL